MDISRLELLYQRWSDCQRHEDREQPRLHVDGAISQMPKCEGVEKPGKDVEHKFALGDN